jgi:hypothetical protein
MAEIAQRVLAGDRLYDTIRDSKSPPAILVCALPHLFAPFSYTGVQVAFGSLGLAAGVRLVALLVLVFAYRVFDSRRCGARGNR